MVKEDFKYEDKERYLFNQYVLETDEYILTISEDIFDEESVKYAEKIANLYVQYKENVMMHMLNLRLRAECSGSDEYIIANMGRPQITIDSRKDDLHPNWKFEYMGTITYLENKVGDHIISIDFIDALKLDNHVSFDG